MEFKFEEEVTELLAQAAVCQTPLCTRVVLYGGLIEAMRLHYKSWETETIQYVDVLSLFQYNFQVLQVPCEHHVINVGDACKDKEACLHMDGLIKCSIVPPERL